MSDQTKACTRCKRELPATPAWFSRHPRGPLGLQSRCKTCLAETKKQSNARLRAIGHVPKAGLTEKDCTKCRIVKPCTPEFFYRNPNGKGGFGTWCKQCFGDYARGRYADQLGSRSRKYIRSYKGRNPERVKAWRDSRKVERWHANLVAHSRGNASRRGWAHDIDVDFVKSLFDKQGGFCHWFRVPMIPSANRRDPQHPSLDRLDITKGYTRDNVVLACLAANMGRSETTVARFTEFIALLRASL